MADYSKRAYELTEKTAGDRGFLYQHPEISHDVPITRAFAEDRLKCMGYGIVHIGPGPVVMVGHGSLVILLCVDMGGLLMEKESGLPSTSVNPGKARCCSHNNHTAMPLGAAKMPEESGTNLKGMIKPVLQPGEETGNDAQEMINDGLLENPGPDAIMAFHMDALLPLRKPNYSKRPTFCFNDVFKIEVIGRAGRGARPHQAVDATNAPAHIITELEALISRECIPIEICMLAVCSIESGTKAFDVFLQIATMTGSTRTYNTGQRALLVRRLQGVVDGISKTLNCTNKMTSSHQNGPLIVSDQAETEMRSYLEGVLGDEASVVEPPIMKTESEDFASATVQVLSVYFHIGTGPDRENGYFCSQHNTRARFNEEMLPYGTVGFANCAARWLENHSK